MANERQNVEKKDVLAHYGVRGMRWGVRRYQNSDGSLTPAGKKRYSSDTKDQPAHEDHVKAHSGKSVKNMSDAELRTRLNRLQMERQYKQLSDSDVKRGKDYVDKAIKAATTVASVTTTAITIYNNYDKIKKIIDGFGKK